MKPFWQNYRAPCIEHQTGCRRCGKAIRDSRAYCGVECSDWFERNHFWSTARWEAIRLACPAGWTGVYGEGARCARCGDGCWNGFVRGPQVNHIVPLNGGERQFTCRNHQENLEVLCHECHLKTTAEQRRAGLIGPPVKIPEPVPLAMGQPSLLVAVDPVVERGTATRE